jgi:hypothetical protein
MYIPLLKIFPTGMSYAEGPQNKKEKEAIGQEAI